MFNSLCFLLMMLAIDLLLLAIFVAVGRGNHQATCASLCFKLDLDNCTSAQVLLVVEYQKKEVSLACQRYSGKLYSACSDSVD